MPTNDKIFCCIGAVVALTLALPPAQADAQRRRRRAPEPEPVVEEPPPPEPTEEDIRARQHFEAGRSYFEASRYADAAREFMESYGLSHRGELLVNVASAHERNLDHAAAIEALQTIQREHPEVMEAAEIERRIAYLERAREAQAAADLAAAQAAATPPPPPPEDPALAILGWTLTGAGAGTLVAGGVMGGVAYDSMEQFERATRVSDQLRLRDQVREQSLIADVLFAAGGTLAAAGVVIVIVDALDGAPAEEASPAAPSARVVPRFSPDGGGVAVVGRF